MLTVLTCLASMPVMSAPFSFGFGPPGNQAPYQAPPPGGYSFRPQVPGNARGLPPTYTPQGQYGYPQTQQAASFTPWLELDLDKKNPFIQQNLILKLRVVSPTNLSTIDPVLPQTNAATIKKLRNPSVRTQTIRGQQAIVNEMVYMVTPLQPGSVELPISVTVTTAGNGYGGQNMTLNAREPLRFEVRPALAEVNPWLALEQLALTSNIDAPMDVEPGKPVTLILKLSAAGAIGTQLPSLEHLLQSPDFRVYRGKTETEGGLSQNGRHVMGTRTEHYTLVPQYGGRLRLPSARVSWYNVTTGTIEHSSLPVKTLDAAGRSAGLERFFGGPESGSLFPAGYASAFWLPLLGIFLLLTGYWLGVWYKGRSQTNEPSPLAPLLGSAGRALAQARVRTGQTLARAFRRVSPVRYWNRALVKLGAFLPTSVRFWFWVKCANDEQDPARWCKTLQFLSCRELALSPYSPLPQMAEKVIQFQPGADATRVRELFRSLDGAIYGRETLDFEDWKYRFRREIKPGIGALGAANSSRKGKAERRLPALNPRAA